jgi:DNA-directed RNA polymerase specialized sigma24 family protein
MPPLDHLQRVPEYHLEALERQGIFTTGLLLEVSETPTRRQYLADQINAQITDVNDWRDEALLLNLANFGPDEQILFTQAGILGLSDLLDLSLDEFRARLARGARALGTQMPTDLITEGWWEQAHTLREE